MRFFTRLPVVTALLVALAACASTATYNPTVYPFEFDRALLAENNVKTVVIPHINLGAPSRTYLEKEAPRIDGYITR